ncbi:ribonuclease toxin immunity protein CdiI [Ralstonia solanacearum]|uniref:ribonuclease toxin immunity protein CdiI n=1 Tax=Ralstonia solanacearum TaxID=305 RepID=UPI0035187410
MKGALKMDLFDAGGFCNDLDRIVKSFFNSIYDQGRFVWALKLLVKKQGCVINEDYCLFPDVEGADPSFHFEGVMFGGPDGEVIVSEEQYDEYLNLACERYIGLCPNDFRDVGEILKGKLV